MTCPKTPSRTGIEAAWPQGPAFTMMQFYPSRGEVNTAEHMAGSWDVNLHNSAP